MLSVLSSLENVSCHLEVCHYRITNDRVVPEKSRWLTPRERHIAKERMSAQQGGKSYEHMTLAQSAKALYDWKVLALYGPTVLTLLLSVG